MFGLTSDRPAHRVAPAPSLRSFGETHQPFISIVQPQIALGTAMGPRSSMIYKQFNDFGNRSPSAIYGGLCFPRKPPEPAFWAASAANFD